MYTTIARSKEMLSRVIVIGDWPSENEDDENLAVENATS